MNDEHTGDEPEAHTDRQANLPAAPQNTVAHSEIAHDPQNQPARDQATTRELRREFRWFEIGSLAVNAVLAVIGIVALTIYGGQLDTMNSQLSAMRTTISQERLVLRQATAQTIAAKKSADAAQEAAGTASATLRNQQSAFVIDQRPYLITTTPVFAETPAPDKGIFANITVKNIGRTPAMGIATELGMKPFHGSKTDREIYKSFMITTFVELRRRMRVGRIERARNPSIRQDVAPGGEYFSTNQTPVFISSKDFGFTYKGEIVIIYAGIVTYADSFNVSYTTEFCYQWSGVNTTSIWHICDSNNTIR